MTYEEKRALWTVYPGVWEMFVEFNGITLEDALAWSRLVGKAHRIGDTGEPILQELLTATVDDLEKIARKRRGCG